jgi:polyphosphate glucokinase
MASTTPITLCVDIGGTGLKMLTLSHDGKVLTERLRTLTPDPSTPRRLLAALDTLHEQVPKFDRVSVGYPGVIRHGVVHSAANLDLKWIGFHLQAELEKRWKKPVRVANDAAIQGYGCIRGKDVEMILTLGTGLGSAIYVDGHCVPLELGHHPWREKTYEDYLGRRGLKHYGEKKWNKLVEKAIEQTAHTFNWDHLYLGGGNTKKLKLRDHPHITIVSNMDGLIGGLALWRDEGS